MKKATALLLVLALCVALSGCGVRETGPYSVTYLDLFDTVTTIIGRAESQAAFTESARQLHDLLLRYHQLFDIYNDYDGMNNLKTVNDHAGIGPVTVDEAIIALLLDCRSYYDLTGGKVNAAMGSVLELWHEARTASLDNPEQSYIPGEKELKAAAAHSSWEDVVIDQQAGTVYLADPELSLDVGAIAKGWAAQRAAEAAPEGMLLSVGGNICATGARDDRGTPWNVGVQNPDVPDEYLQTIPVTNQSIVTSGDYQRYYTVDGVRYHHIIDPQTLYPAQLWRSVTVVCGDSGLADALSTALFLLPQEEGQALLAQCGAEAMWVDAEGGILYSTGFDALLQG